MTRISTFFETELPGRIEMPAEAFCVGEYVADELEARGWTTSYAATLMEGDPQENEIWLGLMCCVPAWEKHAGKITFSEDEAKALEKLLDVSSQTWLNLHESWLKATAHKRN